MAICKKCGKEKPTLDFPFITKKNCYDKTCRECNRIHKVNKERNTLKKWDAFSDVRMGRFNFTMKRGTGK